MTDRAAELAYFTRLIQNTFEPSIRDTGSIPDSAIQDVLATDPFHLDDTEKAWIVRQLEFTFSVTQTIGASISSDYSPWLKQRSPDISFYYWNRLKRYYLEGGGLPANVVSVLDGVTNEILDYCGNPDEEGGWRRRGMVMGHVQSGKTTNYSALICKASDTGYKIIILLAGLTNSLRAQTQERLDETFIGRKSVFQAAVEESMSVVQYSEGEKRIPAYGTSRDKDFNKQVSDYGVTLGALNEPIIFVTKKNKSTLENLRDWIKGQADGGLIGHPVLLIDDEADNASVNTAKDPQKVTAINSVIREILNLFHRSSYVGYTATPFANIFIDPDTEDEMRGDDLFPRHFIKALDPPSNYMGAARVFADDGDLSKQMVEVVDDYRDLLPLKHKKDHPLEELPESLLKALRVFILVRTIRVLRGDGRKHCSMMINVSRFNNVQELVTGLAYTYIEQMKAATTAHAGLGADALRDPSIAELQTTFEKEFPGCEFSFEQILGALPEGIRSIETRTVNMRGGALDYSKHKESGLHVIVVGGLALSRGLTLEGLAVSYILRNTAASDTLMQMARWFGYHPDFEDLCRLYLSEISLEHYAYIAEAIEEFRGEIKRMEIRGETPYQFGLKVRRSETGIRVTAANKMRASSRIRYAQDFSSRHIEGHTLFNSVNINRSNHDTVAVFLDALGDCPVCPETGGPRLSREYGKHLIWNEISGRKILGLLDEFEFPGAHLTLGRIVGKRSLLHDYCSDRIDQELAEWDVIVPLLEGRTGHTFSLADLGSQLPTRSRNTGITKGSNSEFFKPMGDKNRISDPNDAQFLLSEEEISRGTALKMEETSYRGDRAYCAVRKRPLLIVHFFKAGCVDPNFRLADGHVVSLSFCMPRTGVDAIERTYEVNAVYRKQLESLIAEPDDDEAAFDGDEA